MDRPTKSYITKIYKPIHERLESLFSVKDREFGWLIGRKTETEIFILNFMKCMSTTEKSIRVTEEELHEMDTIIPQGLDIVGVYLTSNYCSKANRCIEIDDKLQILGDKLNGFIICICNEQKEIEMMQQYGHEYRKISVNLDECIFEHKILRTSFTLRGNYSSIFELLKTIQEFHENGLQKIAFHCSDSNEDIFTKKCNEISPNVLDVHDKVRWLFRRLKFLG